MKSLELDITAAEVQIGDMLRSHYEVVSVGCHADVTVITYAVPYGASTGTQFGYSVQVQPDNAALSVTRQVSDAYYLGWCAGTTAASWVFNGNSPPESYAQLLRGMEEGDPQILEQLDPPSLSGQYSDSWTSAELARELDTTEDDPHLDKYCEEFETASDDAFWYELEKICRRHVNA